jgi:hypothetical protein
VDASGLSNDAIPLTINRGNVLIAGPDVDLLDGALATTNALAFLR